MAFNDRITLAMRNEVKEASKSLFGNFAQGYEKLFYSYLLRTIEYWEQSIEDGKKQIVKYNKYSKFTVNHLLSLQRNIHEMHVERKFYEGRISLVITLFGRDVFRFQSKGPRWDTVYEMTC